MGPPGHGAEPPRSLPGADLTSLAPLDKRGNPACILERQTNKLQLNRLHYLKGHHSGDMHRETVMLPGQADLPEPSHTPTSSHRLFSRCLAPESPALTWRNQAQTLPERGRMPTPGCTRGENTLCQPEKQAVASVFTHSSAQLPAFHFICTKRLWHLLLKYFTAFHLEKIFCS